MKNPKDFTKLFDLNVPVMEHFDYYIEQLSKTEKFKDIKNLLNLFEEADLGIENIYEYRMSKSNEIINFIKTTTAYNELCYDSMLDFPTNKSFEYESGVLYLSIDMRSANWTSLKKYDQFNDLGDTYPDLLRKFKMPEVFIYSKYLRQLIFGNVNPKRQQKVQRSIMQEDIVRKYSEMFSVECVRSDEVIFKFNKFEDISPILKSLDSDKYRAKLFSVERVEDFRINTVYDFSGNILYKEMSGVSGNQFYIKLKQYITGEKLDIKDLYFVNDGKLAVWCLPELKLEV